MSKRRQRQPDDELDTKSICARRDFVRAGALVAAALAASKDVFAAAAGRPAADEASAIRLGVASYTFRNFSRAQMIGFLKQLNVLALNAKDVKDHLPMEPQEEAAALADYAPAGIKLPPACTIYFPEDGNGAIRCKVDYCQRAWIAVIVAGDPARQTVPRMQ